MTENMLFWLLLVALVELGVITLAVLLVLDRSKQQSPGGEMPMMIPLEELMHMRKDPRLNKPEGNGEEKGSGQYL